MAISSAINHHVRPRARPGGNECLSVVGILRVRTHVRSRPQLRHSNENKTALSNKHAVAPGSPESPRRDRKSPAEKKKCYYLSIVAMHSAMDVIL